MKNKIIKLSVLLVIPLIMLCFVFTGCSKNANTQDDTQKIILPYHLYNSQAKCIAYTSDNYLYDYSTWEAIGIFDYERNVFISTTGKYLGEIVYDNVLTKNTQSQHINIDLGTQPTIPTAPVPRTAPTRATVPTLPSYYQDLETNNTSSIYNLTIIKTGNGSVTGYGNYEENAEVTITATASDNYYFYGWQIGNQLITQSIYTFNMPLNNLTIKAIFYEKSQYTINLSKTDGGWINGSMVLTTMQTNKSSSFHIDELVNLHANASYGYTFAGWYVEGKFFSSETTLSFYMIEYDMHIEAKFLENSATINPPQDTYYSIEVLPTGANGSVSCGITRAKVGTQIIMTATPYLNLTKFDGWYYNGRLLSTNTTYTFTMPANNVIIYARFSSK